MPPPMRLSISRRENGLGKGGGIRSNYAGMGGSLAEKPDIVPGQACFGLIKSTTRMESRAMPAKAPKM